MDFSTLRDIAFLVTRDNIKIPFFVENIKTEYNGYPEVEGVIIGSPSNLERKPVKIERVIFNDPATIVIWSDKTKTIVKCQPGDTYDKEKGLALCICKRFCGNKGNFNEIFKKYIPADEETKQADEECKPVLSIEEMREKLNAFCIGRACNADKCPLHNDSCKCGSGKGFLNKKGTLGHIKDVEIIRVYKIVFGNDKRFPRVRIINAGDGAHGVDNIAGILLPEGVVVKSHNGLFDSDPHRLFLTDGGVVWKISKKATFEHLD